MLDECVQLVAGWLHHPDHGINPLTATVPRMKPDGTEDPEVPEMTIENDHDHKGVAEELVCSGQQGIIVWGDSSEEVKNEKGALIGRQVAIAIAYVTRDSVDVISAIRNCGYLLRGGMRSMRRFNVQHLSLAYRSLNGITIAQVKRIREQRVTGALGSSRIYGFLIVELLVLETLD